MVSVVSVVIVIVITVGEPILGGETVKYANHEMLEATLAYVFKEEKEQQYTTMSEEKIIERITGFTSAIWQVHPFAEGNTRTTALFVERYLNFIGFQVDNSLFKEVL